MNKLLFIIMLLTAFNAVNAQNEVASTEAIVQTNEASPDENKATPNIAEQEAQKLIKMLGKEKRVTFRFFNSSNMYPRKSGESPEEHKARVAKLQEKYPNGAVYISAMSTRQSRVNNNTVINFTLMKREILADGKLKKQINHERFVITLKADKFEIEIMTANSPNWYTVPEKWDEIELPESFTSLKDCKAFIQAAQPEFKRIDFEF